MYVARSNRLELKEIFFLRATWIKIKRLSKIEWDTNKRRESMCVWTVREKWKTRNHIYMVISYTLTGNKKRDTILWVTQRFINFHDYSREKWSIGLIIKRMQTHLGALSPTRNFCNYNRTISLKHIIYHNRSRQW